MGTDPWRDTAETDLQYAWRLDQGEWSAFAADTEKVFFSLESGETALGARHEAMTVVGDDLLAEVTPGVEGKPGTDVLGREIAPLQQETIGLKAGTGVGTTG